MIWGQRELLSFVLGSRSRPSRGTMIFQRKHSAALIFLLIVLRLFLDPSTLHASSKIGSARAQLMLIENSIETFKNDVGRYPTTEEGLDAVRTSPPQASNWDGPYIHKEIPPDPWGHPYVYHSPAKFGTKPYDLYSLGDNGIDDQGERDDVTTWKETNMEYYGGLSKKVRYLLNALAAVVALVISMGLLKRGQQSLPAISSRFAVSSLICMVILIIWGIILVTPRPSPSSIFDQFITRSIIACWLVTSLSGFVASVITAKKFGINVKQVLIGVLCLFPWLSLAYLTLGECKHVTLTNASSGPATTCSSNISRASWLLGGSSAGRSGCR